MLKLLREYISTLLTEAKSDQLKSKFPHLEPEIDELIAGGVETKYLDWAVKQLDAGSNINELIDSLNQFHKNAQRIKSKDINSYGDLESLRSTVDSLGMSKRQESKEILAKGSEKIGETDEYKIYYVDELEASKKLGSGTKWCISGDEADPHFWEYYFAGARFYFCISKTETIETDPKYYKIAISIVEGRVEIYDAQDEEVNEVDIKDLVDISLADYRSKNRDAIDVEKLIKHESDAARAGAASSIEIHQLPQMIDDPSPRVIWVVLRRIDKRYLLQFIDYNSASIRHIVASRIDHKHLPQMMDDLDDSVRTKVARRIDPEHLPQMLNDPSEFVRGAVATRHDLDPSHLDAFVYDPADWVREIVIRRSDLDPKYLEIFANDNDNNIRQIAKSRIKALIYLR